MFVLQASAASAAFDPTDIPRVDGAHFEHLLGLLVGQGHGLLLLRGADPVAVSSLEAAFWAGFEGDTATGVATIVRFRALADVFASRRLKSLLKQEGYAVLKAAFRVAAGIRLNTSRGFSPQGLVWAVTAEMATARRPRRDGHEDAGQSAAQIAA